MSDTDHNHNNNHEPLRIPIGPELAKIMRVVYQRRGSLLLMGDSGVGKSEFVRGEARAMGLDVEVLNLALLEGAGELLGLPRIVDLENGLATGYAVPEFLPKTGAGILVLEELTRVTPHVRSALYEFLTTRRIGSYELPPGWIIVACSNPPGGVYDVDVLDPAMMSRFLVAHVTVDRRAWVAWAKENDIHVAILAIADKDPQLFALHSPRTWTFTSELILAAEEIDVDADTLFRIIALQLSSTEAAYNVVRYIDGYRADDVLEPETVLHRYAHDPDLSARVMADLAQGRTDTVERLAFGVEEAVKDPDLRTRIETGRFDLASFEQFASDVPGDRKADLLRAFAENSASAAAMPVDPDQAFAAYRRSKLHQQVTIWRNAGKHHRLVATAHRIAQHLDWLAAHGGIELLRANARRRKGLYELHHDLGPDLGKPLAVALRRHGLGLESAEGA